MCSTIIVAIYEHNMPLGKKSFKKKSAPRRRRMPRRRMAPRQENYASCVDTVGDLSVVSNTPYSLQNISLTNSARAKTIAQGYQFYRITKVEVKWKPYVDTFASGGLTVPNLYYMIDKANTFPSNTTIATLKQAGAKPVRLDDKVITRSFKPAVHMASDDGAAGPATVVETAAMTKVSPWITTNGNAGGSGALWTPNSVDHRGLVFVIEQQTGAVNAGVASVEIVIHYQFKKPLFSSASGDETVHRIDLDTLEIVPPPLKTPAE